MSALFALLLGVARFGASQQATSAAFGSPMPSQTRDSEGILTLQAGTHLVVLDAVVTDRKGRPVPGLTKEDFQMSEDGRPQTIAFFEEHAPLDSAQIARDKADLAASLPPNTFTSYEPFTSNAVTILMLNELLPVPDYDLEPLRQRMIEVIRSAPPNTPFAVYVLDSQLRLVQPITANRDLLLAATDLIWKNQHFPANESPTGGQIRARRDTLTGSLHKLEKTLAAIPGRKTLFAFTGGLQCNLVAAGPQGHCDAPWPLGFEAQNYLCSVMDLLEQGRISIYRYYPGGQVIYGFGCRDSAADLRHIFDTASNYYTLYYTPTNGDWDGRYRKFNLSLADRGLHVSYREGYYGTAENADGRRDAPVLAAGATSSASAHMPTLSAQDELGHSRIAAAGSETAAAAPADLAPDPMPLVFTVQITPAASPGTAPQATPPSPGNREVERLRLQGYRDYSIRFIVPAKGIRLTSNADSAQPSNPAAWTARLEIAAVSSIRGSPTDARSSQVAVNFDGLTDPRIAKAAITATLTIQIAEHGNRLLHLTVRDLATNQFGRLDIPVDRIVLPGN